MRMLGKIGRCLGWHPSSSPSPRRFFNHNLSTPERGCGWRDLFCSRHRSVSSCSWDERSTCPSWTTVVRLSSIDGHIGTMLTTRPGVRLPLLLRGCTNLMTPPAGNVTYTSQYNATTLGLVSVNEAGNAVIRVDNYSTLSMAELVNRDSVSQRALGRPFRVIMPIPLSRFV